MADYCGIKLTDVWELCCYTYRMLLRDALIEKLSSTSGGREYLKKCWILEQTEPDRKRLREEFGEGG